MSCNWRKVRLGDVCEFNPKEKLVKGEIAKKIAMDCLVPYCRKISSFELTGFSGGSKFRNGDTLMARITPCLENGKTAYVSILDDKEVGFGSTEYIVFREKEGLTNGKYLYYFVANPWFRDIAIKSMVGSSGRQRVQQGVLENLEVDLPPLAEQERIAAILGSLDDKIELNNRINKNLEEQAQALFKRWFVDFEFPDQNGQPYKSSGGAMKDSELGEIPKDWTVGKLGDVGEIIGGGTPSKANDEYYTYSGIAWITPKDLSINKSKFISKGANDISELGYKNSSAKLMPKGSILFSSRAPIGYMAIAKNNVCTNQGFKSIIPKTKIGTPFIYYFLKYNVSLIESKASGSTFKEASGALMKSLDIIIADNSTLQEFNNICNCYFNEQEKLEKETQVLASLRDSLLPKLMSKQISVEIKSL